MHLKMGTITDLECRKHNFWKKCNIFKERKIGIHGLTKGIGHVCHRMSTPNSLLYALMSIFQVEVLKS